MEFYELNGLDYVFDLVNETENSPLVLVMNGDSSFSSNYLTAKKRNKSLSRSGCSTDWYLETGAKFENNRCLEQSIKGTRPYKTKHCFFDRCYKNILRYNYLINKKQYEHLNNLLKSSQDFKLFNCDHLKESDKKFFKNLADKIKGSGRETKTTISAYKHYKLTTSISSVNRDQKDFFKFLNHQVFSQTDYLINK